jgi:hypothetical protein
MKIVNEKGKLFGLINIIDLSIIILILLVGSVFVLKSMGKNVGPNSDSEQTITVTYRGTVRIDDQIKALKEKDQLISVLKPVDAYITSIAINPLEVGNSTADGKQVYSVDPKRKELIVKFTMKTSGNGIIKLDSQDVSVGKAFILKTHTFELSGFIEAIEFK